MSKVVEQTKSKGTAKEPAAPARSRLEDIRESAERLASAKEKLEPVEAVDEE